MQPFLPFARPFIDAESVAAVADVFRSGQLASGPKVLEFETALEAYLGSDRHVRVMTSATAGLEMALEVAGVGEGDEVIVPAMSFAASANVVARVRAKPVFVDIDLHTRNLNIDLVKPAITPRTRAIMAVDIFGQSADMDTLRAIAQRHGLKVISDTAQAPGARYRDGYAGTFAHIGGYSLNYHKHIHCGEGGILVTDDAGYAQRLRLIRNHAEAVISSDDPAQLVNMIGYNFRLGEIESAIAREQLKKLAGKVASRQEAARRVAAGLAGLPGLALPRVAENCTHVYYVFGMKLDAERLGVGRAAIVAALRAEGVTGLGAGYQNVHRLPMFVQGIAYGPDGFPWSTDGGRTHRPSTQPCPVAERLHEREFFYLGICAHEYHEAETRLLIAAFRKVWDNLPSLRAS